MVILEKLLYDFLYINIYTVKKFLLRNLKCNEMKIREDYIKSYTPHMIY